MNKILLSIFGFVFILGLVFISGCSTLQGLQGLGDVAVEKYNNQSSIENKLIEGTDFQNQNLSVARSIIEAIANLKRLQEELDSLSSNIEQINSELEVMQNDSSLDPDTVAYLSYLNELVASSNIFVYELRASTNIWNNYLDKMSGNSSDLDFGEQESPVMIIESVTKPLDAFD